MIKHENTAVAIIESPDGFVLERRPDLPGKLAYPGMLQFFGGHIEEGEDAAEALIREMGEETNLGKNLRDNPSRLVPRETVEFTGQGKQDEPVLRTVSVFTLKLADGEQVQSSEEENAEVVVIPATQEGIDGHRAEITAFALSMLEKVLSNKED